jgi:hypothetical protein
VIYLIVLHTQNHLFQCKDEYDKKRGSNILVFLIINKYHND